MIRVTAAGWGVVACGIALIAVGRLFGSPELFVLGGGAFALCVLAVMWTGLGGLRLTVRRQATPTVLRAGTPAQVELSLTNRNRWRTPIISLHDRVGDGPGASLMLAPIGGRQTRSIFYQLPTSRRGRLGIGPLQLASGDPLGITASRVEGAGKIDVTIHPTIVPLVSPHASSGMDPRTPEQSRHTVATSGDEFFTLRPYEVGDELRRIHWPSSARSTELMVRQPEQERTGWITIILDINPASYRNEDEFERAVTAAASIVYACGNSGATGHFATTADTETTRFHNPGQVAAVDAALAVVHPVAGALLATCLQRLTTSAEVGRLFIVTASVTTDWLAVTDGRRSGGRLAQPVLVSTADQAKPGGQGWTTIGFGPGDDLATAWASGLAPRKARSGSRR